METAALPVNLERLQARRDELRSAFERGDPIRHLVIEEFLEPQAAAAAAQAFPKPQEMAIAFAGLAEVKNAEPALHKLDPVFEAIFTQLRAPEFVAWLSYVTQIPELVPDPELHGGGLHQGPDGSYLDVHADFNIHPQLNLYRRLNLLIYVNVRWEPQW